MLTQFSLPQRLMSPYFPPATTFAGCLVRKAVGIHAHAPKSRRIERGQGHAGRRTSRPQGQRASRSATTRASSSTSSGASPPPGGGGGADGGGDDDGGDGDGQARRPETRYVPPSNLKFHPRADFVPAMSRQEFEALVADIMRDGVREPLAVVGDVVLDGRHRLRAALELKLKLVPVIEVQLNGENELAYIARTALHRRHLSEDQRAMLAANWAAEAGGES